jgi:hypothetical protein
VCFLRFEGLCVVGCVGAQFCEEGGEGRFMLLEDGDEGLVLRC